jgi:two-component system sensor histidine kinase DesK
MDGHPGVSETSHVGGAATDRVVHPAVWTLFTVIWLLFLFYPIRDLLAAHRSLSRTGGFLACMLLFVGIYLWLMLHEPFRDTPFSARETAAHVALLLLLTATVLFLTLADRIDWLWFVMYANMAAAVKLPVRAAALTIATLTLLTVVVGRATADWAIASRIVSPVAAVAVVMVGISQLVVTIRELRAARQEIGRLAAAEAVSEERLRFARDLHDLLGHSLSTITLKNEVARRLIATKPEHAAREIDEAITVAREALQEVREAVSGYRQPTLAIELRSAAEILAAAGIACRCENAGGPLPPATESVLAWAVREGVTNVVRHSRARHCAIRIARTHDTVYAEVRDDGTGAVNGTNTGGNGLRGLAERAGHHRGSVEAGPDGAGGFHLRVTLPLVGRVPSQIAEGVGIA